MGVYFRQTFVICFCQGFSYCPFYWGVRHSGVSARREVTVVIFNKFFVTLFGILHVQSNIIGNFLALILDPTMNVYYIIILTVLTFPQ